MKYAELKAFAAILGRFASVREKADEPSDRIVVQCYDGIAKFVAGVDYDKDASASIAVTAEGNTRGMSVVAARPFLQAAKTLRGKGEVEFAIDNDGLTMKTSAGGEIKLPNVSHEVPALIRSPKTTLGFGTIPKGFLPKAAKLLGATTSMAYGPWTQVAFSHTGQQMHFQGGDNFMHTELSIPGFADPGLIGAIHPSFFDSIKDFDEEGYVGWNENRVIVTQGPYTALTTLMERFPPPLPMPELKTYDTAVIVNRKGLLDAIKTIGGEKVAFEPIDEGIMVSSWPDGQTSQRLKAIRSGKGRMAAMRDRLTVLCTAIGGEEVTLGWEEGRTGAVKITGEHGFVLLSRVILT